MPYNFSFKTVSENDVLKSLNSIKAKSSSGEDGLSTKFIKSIKQEIYQPLTSLVDQMFTTNIFPDQLKIAKVIPLYKKEDPSLLSNYRPVSILPALSKVFEKLIHTKLYNYFESNGILHSHQYGFRKHHSTELASAHVVNTVPTNMDNGFKTIAIFTDLSKVFDTINHEILIDKLKHYGLTDSALNLIKSYLTSRKRFVSFNGMKSYYCTNGCITRFYPWSSAVPYLY